MTMNRKFRFFRCSLLLGMLLVNLVASQMAPSKSSRFRNSAVLRGDNLTLMCSFPEETDDLDLRPLIIWKKIPFTSRKRIILYNGYESMQDRLQFSSERMNTSNGPMVTHRITISPVAISDAGKYFCIDPDTDNVQAAELIVLENQASCDYSVKKHDSAYMSVFLCELGSHGSWTPDIEWYAIEQGSSRHTLIRANKLPSARDFKLTSRINLTMAQLRNYEQVHCKVSFSDAGSPQNDDVDYDNNAPSYNQTTICPYAVIESFGDGRPTTEADSLITSQVTVEMVSFVTTASPIEARISEKKNSSMGEKLAKRPPDPTISSSENGSIPNWVTIVVASTVGVIVLLANIVIFSIIVIRQKRSQKKITTRISSDGLPEIPTCKRAPSTSSRGRRRSQSLDLDVQENAYEHIPVTGGGTYTALIMEGRCRDSSGYAHYCSISDSAGSEEKSELSSPLVSGQNDYLTMPETRKSSESGGGSDQDGAEINPSLTESIIEHEYLKPSRAVD